MDVRALGHESREIEGDFPRLVSSFLSSIKHPRSNKSSCAPVLRRNESPFRSGNQAGFRNEPPSQTSSARSDRSQAQFSEGSPRCVAGVIYSNFRQDAFSCPQLISPPDSSLITACQLVGIFCATRKRG